MLAGSSPDRSFKSGAKIEPENNSQIYLRQNYGGPTFAGKNEVQTLLDTFNHNILAQACQKSNERYVPDTENKDKSQLIVPGEDEEPKMSKDDDLVDAHKSAPVDARGCLKLKTMEQDLKELMSSTDQPHDMFFKRASEYFNSTYSQKDRFTISVKNSQQ